MVLKNKGMIIYIRIPEKFNSIKGGMNIFSLEKVLFMYVGFYSFQLKEETNRDYSFPAGLEDHILGENMSPNTSVSGLVPSELTQSNTSLGSSSSSGDVGKLQYSTGMERIAVCYKLYARTFPCHYCMCNKPHLLRWADRFFIWPHHTITYFIWSLSSIDLSLFLVVFVEYIISFQTLVCVRITWGISLKIYTNVQALG